MRRTSAMVGVGLWAAGCVAHPPDPPSNVPLLGRDDPAAAASGWEPLPSAPGLPGEWLLTEVNGAPYDSEVPAIEGCRIERDLALEFSRCHVRAINELAGGEHIDLVAVHGQTVFHDPPRSWQMIAPTPIAHALETSVVCDLRAADLADYQDELERAWVEELKNTYEVVVHDAVFQGLVK